MGVLLTLQIPSWARSNGLIWADWLLLKQHSVRGVIWELDEADGGQNKMKKRKEIRRKTFIDILFIFVKNWLFYSEVNKKIKNKKL